MCMNTHPFGAGQDEQKDRITSHCTGHLEPSPPDAGEFQRYVIEA